MKTTLIRSILAAAMAVGVSLVASAQFLQPKPIDAKDPLAVRAGALVQLILAGDQAAAVALLTKEAADTYTKARIESDVAAQVKRLSDAKYTIAEYNTGLGADVMVLLTGDKGQEANIVVRFNEAKRMIGFAVAKIGAKGGGS